MKDPQEAEKVGLDGAVDPLSPSRRSSGIGGHPPHGSSSGVPSPHGGINLKHESSLVTPDLLEALRGSKDR